MPYIIALIAIVVAAVAFTMLRTDPAVDTETQTTTEEVRLPEDNTTEEPTTESEEDMQNTETNTMIAPEADLDISLVSEMVDETPATQDTNTTFANGSYTTQTSYFTPRRTEHSMDVTLTIENDVVTEAVILWDGEASPKTPNHSGFDAAYKSEVIRQPLSEISLSRVGGASLTTDAFNEAVDTIEAQAQTS
jgi:hypothetical protein